MEADKIKRLTRALSIITALDTRTAQGRMNEQASAALKDAEACIETTSGRLVLAAFRAWNGSGVKSFDPTDGYVRETDERSQPKGRYSNLAMRTTGY